jgi:hypothetical protein
MGGQIDWQHPFLLIFLSQLCISTRISLVEPMLPFYASSFQTSYTLVGLMMAAFGISRIFIEIPGSLL